MAGITACREVDNNPTVNPSRVQKRLLVEVPSSLKRDAILAVTYL